MIDGRELKTVDSGSVLNVALIAPEIPHNTGNIIRLCANVGARLHLLEPIGFLLDNPGLRRASLDYGDLAEVLVHSSIEALFESVFPGEVYGAVTQGAALYTTPRYQQGDTIIFGSESVGLSSHVVDKIHFENRVQIPMMPANRSLNLSNAEAIIVYEMWRQIGFLGAASLPDKEQLHFS